MNCFSVKGQYEVCPFCGYVDGTPTEQPHYLTPGTILGNHFIVGTAIGFGGFGITYKCFDTTLGVTVAVKEFYPVGLVNRSPGESKVGLLSGDKKEQYAEQLKRFLMEAQSVAQFGKAKDIVNVYDFFEENNTAYIIMEYIDGVLLKDYLEKQGAMNPEAAMSVIMPIIEAVKKIHSKGIIHRDISPDNIFIASEDTIKIFDFGAAQLNDSKEGQSGEKVIKVGYSAPEQYRDRSRQGFFTDIYSVGAILYQMLTGIKPVESTEREFKDELKSPLELGVDINSNIDRAVMEAMAVRSELRFQGIQQFEDALLNKRIAEYPQEKLKKRRRRRTWIISSAAALVLAVAVVIGLYSTILKPENRIFDTQLQSDTVTVWVESEEQKEDIDDLVANGFKKGDTSDSSEDVSRIQQEDENITVNVEVKEDMNSALEQAEESGSMPNMFLSDHVSDIDSYDLVSLQDNVYASLNTDDYLFMNQYETTFDGAKEMPTGIDTLLLYALQFDYKMDNTLDNSANTGSEDGTVELSELVSEDESSYKTDGKLSSKLAVFEENANILAALLENSNWSNVFSGKEIPDQNMRKGILAIQNFNSVAKKKKNAISQDTDSNIYGSNVVAGASYRKVLNSAKDDVEKEKKGINPLSDYKTYVVTNENKMLVIFSDKYAITNTSSENQKTACMRLLWVMMGEKGQEKKTSHTGATSYPILRKSFEEFSTYNANFSGFSELVNKNYACTLIGADSGSLYAFAQGLGTMTDEQQVKSYCEQFGKDK
jgi:serine/threonine protein kinase